MILLMEDAFMAKVIKNKSGTKYADELLINKSSLTIKAGQGNDTINLSKGSKNRISDDLTGK